ncbi:MAG: N-acetylmannosamine-6-phosphate 2-epimerase [Acutalibacter sp.]
MSKEEVLKRLYRKVVVSCQALPEEPLFGSQYMAVMARAAKEGGAGGIRANSVVDIRAIRQAVDLPVIGIIKAEYPHSPVYITPTWQEAEALIQEGVEVVAMDATLRTRPNGVSLEDFFRPLREKYPDQLFMADCSTFEECENAQRLGFDIAATTLRGYTEATQGAVIPDYALLQRLTQELTLPIIAEGGIWERDQLRQVFQYPVHAAVIGTAITRPREITRRFVDAISGQE